MKDKRHTRAVHPHDQQASVSLYEVLPFRTHRSRARSSHAAQPPKPTRKFSREALVYSPLTLVCLSVSAGLKEPKLRLAAHPLLVSNLFRETPPQWTGTHVTNARS